MEGTTASSEIKTKTKGITLANHNEQNKPRNQSELEANTCNRRQARENACDQVTIGFSLASDWFRKWREFFEPIRERTRQNQSTL